MPGLDQQVIQRLHRLRADAPVPLRVRLWQGDEISLSDQPSVTLHLKSPAAARRLIRPSLHTLGEAYVEGMIDLDGPVEEAIEIASRLSSNGDDRRPIGRLPRWLARHSRRSDRSAVAYHYDVSNAFYRRFLDPRMVYSCAYYREGTEDLATAQLQKLDHVCRKLRLAPGQRLLDIGCGWGALVIRAAETYGVQAVGITLSRNQFELARERVEQAGLQKQVEIRLQDYRDVPADGGFDRIASIGMFEHVGLANLGRYFRRIHELLAPGGIAMNHGITAATADNRWVGMGGGEFIDRYVFPNGELPHVSLAIRELAEAGLELADAESLRRHYALTLSAWSEAFEQHHAELQAIAGEKTTRIWRVYLAGCAYAFAHGWINLYQLLAFKPKAAPGGLQSPLPLTRDYMYRDA
jgi:cyclopropane-fatty-acyl-phospholipid synthase